MDKLVKVNDPMKLRMLVNGKHLFCLFRDLSWKIYFFLRMTSAKSTLSMFLNLSIHPHFPNYNFAVRWRFLFALGWQRIINVIIQPSIRTHSIAKTQTTRYHCEKNGTNTSASSESRTSNKWILVNENVWCCSCYFLLFARCCGENLRKIVRAEDVGEKRRAGKFREKEFRKFSGAFARLPLETQ